MKLVFINRFKMESENLDLEQSYKEFEKYDAQIQQDVGEFNMLLDSITSAEDRKKVLWKKIYYNAIIDRRNAFMM